MVLAIYLEQKNYKATFLRLDWQLMIMGSLIVIFSFTIDYVNIIINSSGSLPPENMINKLRNYEPKNFNWFIFGFGWAILLLDIILFFYRNMKHKKAMPDSL